MSGRKRLPKINMFLPCQSIKGHQTGDSIASDLNAAFQPRLPTDVATWDEGTLSVDNDKLGMHDTERQNEDALDLEIQTTKLFWIWQS